MIKNKVSIIGLGYVGLPLALAIDNSNKYQVFGLDTDSKKIEEIKKKSSPIEDELAEKLIQNHNLTVSTNPDLIKDSEYIIVCVPTPVLDDKTPNLNPIKKATETVLNYLEKGQKIIIESTVNPGICEEVILPILEKNGLKGGSDFELSHCPERINPGDQKWNVLNIPRNIGSLSLEGNTEVANFYRSFLKTEINEVSNIKIAEASKIIENTFRDINIAYVNELAKSFDKMNIDLVEVISAASNKPFAFIPHFPSCGVGGHCIPVDPYYLIESAKKIGFEHSFLKKAREVNESMPNYTVELLIQKCEEEKLEKSQLKIALLGLSYKANVADLRESPSLKILSLLETELFKEINVFDPFFPEKNTYQTLEETLHNSDCIILATSHQYFIDNLSRDNLKKNKIKIVIDGKNCLNKSELKKVLTYKGIGH